MRRGGNALDFHVSSIPRRDQQLRRLAKHTANAYERRTLALAGDPCRWVSMSAKSDRHTRVRGPVWWRRGGCGESSREGSIDRITAVKE